MLSEVVLVVDDDPVSRHYLSGLLEKLGFNPLCLEDGINLTFSCSYFAHVKAVLLDMNMPGLDGYKAAKRIRKLDRKKKGFDRLPIIAVSGIEGNEKKCLRCGCDLYLKKPVLFPELVEAFRKLGVLDAVPLRFAANA
ncbi:MAG: response regulator [Chitinispirillaceae bacterium]